MWTTNSIITAYHLLQLLAVDEAKARLKNAQHLQKIAVDTANRARGRQRQPIELDHNVIAACAVVAAAQEQLDQVQSDNQSQGTIEALSAAMIDTKVLQKTFNIEIKQHTKGDGATITVSSLTGMQAQKLLGRSCPAGQPAPFRVVIMAGLGDCGHGVGAQPSLETPFCYRCNALFIFHEWGHRILPVLQALTPKQLDASFRDIFPPSLAFDEDVFHAAVQLWGKVITHTFYEGGSRSIISDYCKYVLLCVAAIVLMKIMYLFQLFSRLYSASHYRTFCISNFHTWSYGILVTAIHGSVS